MSWLGVKNDAYSTLAATINTSTTSLAVASSEGARFPTSNFHLSIDNEILVCSSRSTDTFTVTRAAESTEAASHSAGASVQLRVTAGIVTELQNAVDTRLTLGGDMVF